MIEFWSVFIECDWTVLSNAVVCFQQALQQGRCWEKGILIILLVILKFVTVLKKKIKKEGIRLVDRYNMNEYLIGVQCKKVIL